MLKKGRFIVVEGLEGAGKTTAVQTIQQYLANHVPSVLVTREPGGTKIAEQIRALITHNQDERLDPRSELLLIYAARIQLLEQVIKPALQAGTWVLADRFELSTFAYQGGGRGLDQQMIYKLSSFCLQDFKPDLILFLDVNLEEGLRRIKQRGDLDRIEQEPLAFFKNVFNAYHERITKMDQVICIDANQPWPTVHKGIIHQLERFLVQNFYA